MGNGVGRLTLYDRLTVLATRVGPRAKRAGFYGLIRPPGVTPTLLSSDWSPRS
jgi:hypothetical protein